MLTVKLKNKSVSNTELLGRYTSQNTGLFMKLYNNFELSEDRAFRKELLDKFNLFDVSMLDFCIDDVSVKLNQYETRNSKMQAEIISIKKVLGDKKLKRKIRYKLNNKLVRLKKDINKNICFGGKDLIRIITKSAQEGKSEQYEKYLAEFQKKRKLGIYLIGRANEGGNRKVDFDLTNNRIVFKPSKNNHIEIEFTSRRDKDLLAKLQQMADAKLIPITVRISEDYTYLSYDESLVAGYAFDKTGFYRAIKEQNIKTKEGRKELWKSFMAELEERKLVGKIKNRFASIDINPQEIGLVIAEKINDKGDNIIIYKETFDLSKHSSKLKLSSSDSKQFYQNNKRKHEVREVWKKIFELCEHYRVYNFVMEDLEFKPKAGEKNSKEANRKTKNIWHRELTEKLIAKWTNIYGLNLIPVNPCYSSFMGNLIHNDYDPIASARELLRRGIIKYIKGNSLYPAVSSINRERLIHLLGENVPSQEFLNWNKLYKQISSAGLRYRNKDKELLLNPYQANYLNGCEQSGVLRLSLCS